MTKPKTSADVLKRIIELKGDRDAKERAFKDARSEVLNIGKETLIELFEKIDGSDASDPFAAQQSLVVIQDKLATRKALLNTAGEAKSKAKSAFEQSSKEFFDYIDNSRQGELFNE